MITFSSEPVINYSHTTPSWVKSERYLYCDNFERDLAKSGNASFLASIRKLLQK